MGLGSSFLRAENQADWRILALLHPMLKGVIEIKVHLSGIGIAELTHLQIDPDQRA